MSGNCFTNVNFIKFLRIAECGLLSWVYLFIMCTFLLFRGVNVNKN